MTRLIAPDDYSKLSPEAKIFYCNGCGTKGLGGWLVPDTLYGLSITEACNVHDYMYHLGTHQHEKDHADRVFLDNMYRIVHEGKQWGWLKWLRRRRAYKYYLAVQKFGGGAFYGE